MLFTKKFTWMNSIRPAVMTFTINTNGDVPVSIPWGPDESYTPVTHEDPMMVIDWGDGSWSSSRKVYNKGDGGITSSQSYIPEQHIYRNVVSGTTYTVKVYASRAAKIEYYGRIVFEAVSGRWPIATNPKVVEWGDLNITTVNLFYHNNGDNIIDTPRLSGTALEDTFLFQNGSILAPYNITKWNTQYCTSLKNTFGNIFNQNVNNWPVHNVTNMANAFGGSPTYNQPLDKWDTSKVTQMSGMFLGCTAFNQDISMWDTSSLTQTINMFNGCSAFNQPIGNWNMSSVNDMSGMFRSCTTFNQDITAWDTSSVTSMELMFYNATAFNQPIGNWDVGNVFDFTSMFIGASSFNQNLGNWNLTGIASNQSFSLSSTNMSQQNNSDTLVAWAAKAATWTPITLTLNSNGLNANGLAAKATLEGYGWTITIL